MLQSLLITDDREAAELIARAIRQLPEIHLEQILCPSPTHYQLTRALNTLRLDVLFLDLASHQVQLVCEETARKSAKTAIAGFSMDRLARHDSATAHHLTWPFSSASLRDAVQRAVRSASGMPLPGVYCFIPAKGGAGATTITVNLACHLVFSLGKSVLVAEADLRSGTMADWLGTRASQSMAQTLACADSCMSLIWPRHVSRKYGVDWMLTDREPSLVKPTWGDYRQLLTFASTRYDYAFVDLPAALDEDAWEAALISRKAFVVTTPEVLSLRLAGQRIAELEAFGVPKSRVEVLVNRAQRGDAIGINQIRETLACEIGGVFPNDYPVVNRSIAARTFVDSGSKLGRAYNAFAAALAGHTRPELALAAKPSLLGFLSSPRRNPVRV